jgi:protein gp37
MTASTIEWTEHTWNPTVGCSRVSPGCDRCYAISVTHRAMQPAHEGLTIKRPGEPTDWTGEVRCLPERLDVPLRRRKPTTYFVDSMSDLFHRGVPLDFILKVWSTMSQCPQHTFQVLTKRPQRMAQIVSSIAWYWEGDDKGGEAYAWPGPHSGDDDELGQWEWRPTEDDLEGGGEEPLRNVWLGTSIESDSYVFRAEHLRDTPAAVRFLSLEPLLGPLPSLDLTGIDWVIVGGESGPGARPMHPDWVRDIRDRCLAAAIPFFFKQWGAWAPIIDPHMLDVRRGDIVFDHDGTEWTVSLRRLGKKAAGRELDGRTWSEMPVRP